MQPDFIIRKRALDAMRMLSSGQYRGTVDEYLTHLGHTDLEERAAILAEWERQKGQPLTLADLEANLPNVWKAMNSEDDGTRRHKGDQRTGEPMTDSHKPKDPTSFRISEETKRLLQLLAELHHRSQARELEWLVAQAAKKEGIK